MTRTVKADAMPIGRVAGQRRAAKLVAELLDGRPGVRRTAVTWLAEWECLTAAGGRLTLVVFGAGGTDTSCWVAMRFECPALAVANGMGNFGSLNTYSGKWNYHPFDDATPADVVRHVGERLDLVGIITNKGY